MIVLSVASSAGALPTELDRLITGTARGDADAFAALYRETKSAVYALALSILRSTYDAEDVMQDTFVSIRTMAGEYRAMEKPMAWILTICRNHSLRRLQTRQERENELPEQWVAENSGLSETDRLLLRELLALLTTEERQIVTLHAVAGFKHREIAALLRLPLPTVLSKYHRAMKKLKKELEKEARV